MDFDKDKREAIWKMAQLIMRVNRRLEDSFPVNSIICNHGMKIIDHLEESNNIIEYNDRLPSVIDYFQTYLNNEFPWSDDALNYFIANEMDLGENSRKEVYREMMLRRLKNAKVNQ